jgi:Na+/phosphate symporter
MKTWKPTTAGVLNIITGAFNALGVIGLIIAIIVISSGAYTVHMHFLPPADAPLILPILTNILVLILVITIIQTVLPIVGGVFALQRRKWGWALAGSITAILGMFPLGVASTIFVSMAKEEFESL